MNIGTQRRLIIVAFIALLFGVGVVTVRQSYLRMYATFQWSEAEEMGDFPASAGVMENCEDGMDNDTDGATDCVDSDCTGDPACVTPPGPGPSSVPPVTPPSFPSSAPPSSVPPVDTPDTPETSPSPTFPPDETPPTGSAPPKDAPPTGETGTSGDSGAPTSAGTTDRTTTPTTTHPAAPASPAASVIRTPDAAPGDEGEELEGDQDGVQQIFFPTDTNESARWGKILDRLSQTDGGQKINLEVPYGDIYSAAPPSLTAYAVRALESFFIDPARWLVDIASSLLNLAAILVGR